MFSLNVKKPVVLLAIFAIFIGFVVGCNNPFNLGEKVDVEFPEIWDITPGTGAYLMDEAVFEGLAGAYRNFQRLEVRILDPHERTPTPIRDWTEEGIILSETNARHSSLRDLRSWEYRLNTRDTGLFGERDGFLKIQFRVFDNTTSTETVELVYIIKNHPSDIRMTPPML